MVLLTSCDLRGHVRSASGSDTGVTGAAGRQHG